MESLCFIGPLEGSKEFNDGELESRLRLWKKIVTKMERRNARRMGLSLSRYKKLVKDEYWLDSDTSIKKRAADKIISLSCSKELTNRKVDVAHRTFLGVTIVEENACPNLR